MKLERDKTYRTATGGKVVIVATIPPDGNGCSYVGTLPGNGSVMYRPNGACPENANHTITGPWVEDQTLYQPMKVREDGSGIVIGALYADIDKLKAEHPDCEQIARVTTENGVISLQVVNR